MRVDSGSSDSGLESEGHFPIKGPCSKCVFCWNFKDHRRNDTSIRCRKCGKALCVVSRDPPENVPSCFERYHTLTYIRVERVVPSFSIPTRATRACYPLNFVLLHSILLLYRCKAILLGYTNSFFWPSVYFTVYLPNKYYVLTNCPGSLFYLRLLCLTLLAAPSLPHTSSNKFSFRTNFSLKKVKLRWVKQRTPFNTTQFRNFLQLTYY